MTPRTEAERLLAADLLEQYAERKLAEAKEMQINVGELLETSHDGWTSEWRLYLQIKHAKRLVWKANEAYNLAERIRHYNEDSFFELLNILKDCHAYYAEAEDKPAYLWSHATSIELGEWLLGRPWPNYSILFEDYG